MAPVWSTRERSTRVVVVEDNPGDADLTSEWLESGASPVDVVQVPSLADACEALAEPADVVILDLNLPDSVGVDTLRRVRSVAPDASVVVVTGEVDPPLRDALLAEGALDVMSKADSNERLLSRTVSWAVERHRSREIDRQVRTLLDSSPDAMIMVDAPGNVRYVNDAALNLFGRTRDSFEGESLAFSTVNGVPVELNISRPGAERVGELRVVDLNLDGPGHLATIRDVTERRQLEMRLLFSDRMVSMGTLAAGVAHEINTPLTAVIANLELAISDASRSKFVVPTHTLVEHLTDARDAAERVRQIVRDLKVLSRPEEDRRVPIELHAVVESTIRLAWNEIRHRARLSKDLQPVPLVLANESRLGQVLLNLIVNAAQAIQVGHADRNEIRISTRTAPNGSAVFEITDTGEGIPDDVKSRLFTPFVSTKETGTGLGLAISLRLVKSMGGEITFTSERGTGTTFTVVLPPAELDFPLSASATPEPANTRRGRVMVIDDDPMVVKVAVRSLGDAHEVIGHTDPNDALAQLQAGDQFDVILCDLMMPQMTGMELRERLCAVAPSQVQRMVFMSGGAFTRETQAFLDSLPNERIDKPFGVRSLQALVNRWVG